MYNNAGKPIINALERLAAGLRMQAEALAGHYSETRNALGASAREKVAADHRGATSITGSVEPSQAPGVETSTTTSPSTRTRYPTKDLESYYEGEEIPAGLPGSNIWWTKHKVSPITYLNNEQRAAYLITVREDGKLYDAEGNLFDTRKGSKPSGNRKRCAIFVMDENGSIYASNYHELGRFHHSSLVAGESVAGAGEIRVENGVITHLSDKSGHYKPTFDMMVKVIERLDDSRADFSRLELEAKDLEPIFNYSKGTAP
ncbi:hypothetical protein [Nocardia sp. NPDC057440]|uniref:hypothetical protein n=1 Tax=Nocardia sp. NPDC057440 TaxID=3346134 RepID=UPI003672657B